MLTTEKRVQVVVAFIGGAPRLVQSRMTSVAEHTSLNPLEGMGCVCAAYHRRHLRRRVKRLLRRSDGRGRVALLSRAGWIGRERQNLTMRMGMTASLGWHLVQCPACYKVFDEADGKKPSASTS